MTVKELLKKQNEKAEYYKKMIDEDTSYERFCAFEGCDKVAMEHSKYCSEHHTLKKRYHFTKTKQCEFPLCENMLKSGKFCILHSVTARMSRIGLGNLTGRSDPLTHNDNWKEYVKRMDELGRWTEKERIELVEQGLLTKGGDNDGDNTRNCISDCDIS